MTTATNNMLAALHAGNTSTFATAWILACGSRFVTLTDESTGLETRISSFGARRILAGYMGAAAPAVILGTLCE
jgi:hypothetical protein